MEGTREAYRTEDRHVDERKDIEGKMGHQNFYLQYETR